MAIIILVIVEIKTIRFEKVDNYIVTDLRLFALRGKSQHEYDTSV